MDANSLTLGQEYFRLRFPIGIMLKLEQYPDHLMVGPWVPAVNGRAGAKSPNGYEFLVPKHFQVN